MKANYTRPKVVRCPNGQFLVYYRFNGKAIREKRKVNYVKDLEQREYEAHEMCICIWEDLKNGYDPTIKAVPETKVKTIAETITLSEALDFGLSMKSGKAKGTQTAYKSAVNAFQSAILTSGYESLLLADTKRLHIKAILDQAANTKKWSKKSCDKNLTYIQAVLDESVKKFYIEVNPAHKIPFQNDERGKSKRHVPATPEQHKLIMSQLRTEPSFFNFVEMEYHTGMRPFEILQIQLRMIDLVSDRITLPAGICKDNEERLIPINKHLRRMLIDMEIYNYPDAYYLFGSFRTSGRGNVGHQNDFIPGPTKVKDDTANRRWRKLIIDGLGINVTLYSYKKFGVNAKLAAGMSMQAVGGLLGHSDEKTTRIYATDLYKEVAKEVYALSPDFV